MDSTLSLILPLLALVLSAATAFDVWVYGDETLRRGSGLFIPQTGVATNHHFLLPLDATDYKFQPGPYVLEVRSSIIGERRARLLASFALVVTAKQTSALGRPEYGLYFDWDASTNEYRSHIRARDKTSDMMRPVQANKAKRKHKLSYLESLLATKMSRVIICFLATLKLVVL